MEREKTGNSAENIRAQFEDIKSSFNLLRSFFLQVLAIFILFSYTVVHSLFDTIKRPEGWQLS